ncbi:MAG: hypothetical protein ACRES7_09675 [Gammaproteobacteria bacterium]
MRDERDNVAGYRHYSRDHVSLWPFIVIAVITVTAILAGVFQLNPLMRFVNWLAVVL